jgi:hypothetical protein
VWLYNHFTWDGLGGEKGGGGGRRARQEAGTLAEGYLSS